MPRQILLIRHCQSQANADGRIEGKGDSLLSEAGREQARRVAAFVAANFAASWESGEATLIASHLARARATAAEIEAACGWTVSHDPRIREGELGWMEDMTYADVFKHMAENKLTALDHEVHGGESLDKVADRCWQALSEVLAATEGPLIAVSHGIAIQALVTRRFGHPLGLAQIGNGDVFELWIEGDAVAAAPVRHALG